MQDNKKAFPSIYQQTSCRASECPYLGVTVLTEGSRVSQVFLLRLYLKREKQEGDQTTKKGYILTQVLPFFELYVHCVLVL